MSLDIGQASRPCPGETVCGDAKLVLHSPSAVFVAVVDGLGHGPNAAAASALACEFFTVHPEPPLAKLLMDCDRVLTHTRGAAATLVWVDKASLRLCHAGVGNVELSSTRATLKPICRPGIVGAGIRSVRETEYQLERGDRVAVFTDGVSNRFEIREFGGTAQEIAEQILDSRSKGHDDATCVVIAV